MAYNVLIRIYIGGYSYTVAANKYEQLWRILTFQYLPLMTDEFKQRKVQNFYLT